MGYTHYWYRVPELPEREWRSFLKDAIAILGRSGARLVKEYNEPGQPPMVTPDLICFNGVGEEGHETFYFPRIEDKREIVSDKKHKGFAFAFCKTAQKPYDAAVCAVLLAAKRAFGQMITISSDGEWEEWEPGRKLYALATGDAAATPWPTWTCEKCGEVRGENIIHVGKTCYFCMTEAQRDEYYRSER